MIFWPIFFRGALTSGGGVEVTLSTVVHTRGSGKELMSSEQGVDPDASGHLVGPVTRS